MTYESPDFLSEPGRGAGVRRLNRRPLIIVGAVLCLILIAISYTYQMRLAEQRRRSAAQGSAPEPVETPAILKDAPDGYIAPRQAERQDPPPAPTPILIEKPSPPPAPEPDPYAEEWASYRQDAERQRQARAQAAQQALRAPTPLKRGASAPAKTPADTAPQAGTVPGQLASSYAAEALRLRAATREEQGEAEQDLNRAAQKRSFLGDRAPEAASAHYLAGGREAPLSPYEIKAGTVIAATMVGGVNSDLPGQILGQVAENVYDTASGRFILIPQGAKLVGTYDNAVTTGQERVLVAWTRIIFPDASSIDLGKMPGTDASGLAGLHDQVNTHFWQMFSSALMLSVIGAGAQVSQGTSPTPDDFNAQELIAAGIGQQFGELGQELARRNARIQPTLEIRPGYRFTVSITKDIVLKPWTQASGRKE